MGPYRGSSTLSWLSVIEEYQLVLEDHLLIGTPPTERSNRSRLAGRYADLALRDGVPSDVYRRERRGQASPSFGTEPDVRELAGGHRVAVLRHGAPDAAVDPPGLEGDHPLALAHVLHLLEEAPRHTLEGLL